VALYFKRTEHTTSEKKVPVVDNKYGDTPGLFGRHRMHEMSQQGIRTLDGSVKIDADFFVRRVGSSPRKK